MELFVSSRAFRIWDYRNSDHSLLIRSEYDWQITGSQNIDLLFDEVFYMEIPFGFHGLEITAPTVADLKYLAERGEEAPDNANYYVLISQGKRYYLGATQLTIEHNSMDYK